MFQREKKAKAKPAKKETKQAKLDFEGEFELPSVDLLARPAANAAVQRINEESLEKNARLLETVLDDFGVKGQITRIRPGPVVTLYELEPAPGTKTSRVVSPRRRRRALHERGQRAHRGGARPLASSASSCRTASARPWSLRELLEDEGYNASQAKLALVLGKDIGGAADRGRPGAHAASADRRHHRLGQVGRDQHHDHVAALPADARPVQVHHDRSQDAGAVGL